MKPVTAAELVVILRANARYHRGLPGGRRALLQDRDFSGLDVSGMDFSRADLTGSRLRGVHAPDTVWIGATAAGCDFTDADLSRADFTRAVLCGSSLRGAVLFDAVFLQADLRPGFLAERDRGGVFERRQVGSRDAATDLSGARLAGANLRRAHLEGVTAAETDFSDAVLTRANLQGAQMRGARFNGSILEDCALNNADLTRADFRHAIVLGVDFGSARLEGTALDRTLRADSAGRTVPLLGGLEQALVQHREWLDSLGKKGRRLDLSEADLRGTSLLRGGVISMADLGRAVLYQLDLSGLRMHAGQAPGADFRLSELSGADLRGSNLAGALFARANGYRADLSALPLDGGGTMPTLLREANFRYGDFREARFAGCDLSGADFRSADLTAADFTDATLDGADFTGAIGFAAPTRAMWGRSGRDLRRPAAS